MAFKKYNIRIDGINTQYCIAGKGKPLIIPPGWRCDIDRFSGVFEFLEKYYKVYFLNMPGYGNNSEFSRPHTMENYAEFILKWIKMIGIEKADILGISMGGPITYHIMKRDTGRMIEKVVFLAPWYNISAVNYPKLFLLAIKNACRIYKSRFFTKLFEKVYYNDRITLFFMRMISPKENFKKPEMMKKYVDNLKRFTGRATLESMFYILDCDLDKEKKTIPNKAVFIMSKNDHQINYDISFRGYRRLFPNITEIPLTHKFHAPRTWITKKMISDYFGDAFTEASKL